MGKIMRVQMPERKVTFEDVPQKYAGFAGRGLTSMMVTEEVPPG
jgi:hypothetical protein